MMRRCCGVYDFGCLRVGVAAPNSLPTFVCVFVCPWRYAPVSRRVCAVS
ncbi:retrotransposon hot spot (RHS) protein, putative, partial [Trypanosoma cruzi]